jgi:hypothetical protein
VQHVYVDGEQVVRDGRMVRIDELELLREVARAGGRIMERLGSRKLTKLRWPVE